MMISSYGHAGISNTVRYAQQVTGVIRLHAVVGGWHLTEGADDVISRTLDALVNSIRRVHPDAVHGVLDDGETAAGDAGPRNRAGSRHARSRACRPPERRSGGIAASRFSSDENAAHKTKARRLKAFAHTPARVPAVQPPPDGHPPAGTDCVC